MDKRYNKNNTDTHRQCSRCKKVLERSKFSKSRQNHDGLVTSCKDCNKKMNAKSYIERKESIVKRRQHLKEKCVSELGGKCIRCGYNEFSAGLDFHHTKDKEEGIADLITRASTGSKKYEKALADEIEKCVLLCRNCHSAYHANQFDFLFN